MGQSWQDWLFGRRPKFAMCPGVYRFLPTLVLQLLVQDDGCACLVTLSGREVSRTTVDSSDLLLNVEHRLLDDIAGVRAVSTVLPSGELLLALLARNPSISFASALGQE